MSQGKSTLSPEINDSVPANLSNLEAQIFPKYSPGMEKKLRENRRIIDITVFIRISSLLHERGIEANTQLP
jgi:hypothetical protein